MQVDVPSRGGGGGALRVKGKAGQEGKMEEAQKACRQFAPSGGPGDGKPMSTEDQEKFLKFAQCMRDNGIPMADPEFEGGGVRMTDRRRRQGAEARRRQGRGRAEEVPGRRARAARGAGQGGGPAGGAVAGGGA